MMSALTITLTNHAFLVALKDVYCTRQYAIGVQKRRFQANTWVFRRLRTVFNELFQMTRTDNIFNLPALKFLP